MKKLFVPIIFMVSLSIIVFVIVIDAKGKILSSDEALKIGEERYLKFLWMVDGAFNSERFKEDYIVNGKSMKMDKDSFTCVYKKSKDKECVGNNFESEFKNLFSKTINYDKVYSDEAIYSWLSIKDGKYIFNNLDSCSVNRMGQNHELKVVKIGIDKIVYEASFINRKTNQVNNRKFILILEDNKWKISYAFYYDLCGMLYTIN